MSARRRSDARRHVRRRHQEVWHAFDPRSSDRVRARGFGAIEALDEHDLEPGTFIPAHPRREAELLTYVREGTISFEDAHGRPGIIGTGEFQRMTSRRRGRHGAANVSRTDRAHVFQMRLRPMGGVRQPGHEERRFSTGERRGVLCLVASPDGRDASLRIDQDARVFSALLHPGQHVVHELAPGRRAWLHLVKGEATVGDLVLTTGDDVSITGDRSVSMVAREETEILLVDVAGESRVTSRRGPAS